LPTSAEIDGLSSYHDGQFDLGAAVRTLSKIGALASMLVASLGASAQDDLDAKLLTAAQKANPAEVRALLAAGADANARAADGSTAMLYAAHFGDTPSVQALLGAKADPNFANRYGVAPAHEAALRADAELLRILLDAGASVDVPLLQGETPLMLASRTGGADAVRLLIERGANVNVVEQWQGQTPLMYAAAADRGDVAAALMRPAQTSTSELRSTICQSASRAFGTTLKFPSPVSRR
jgi:uncharacterized protein